MGSARALELATAIEATKLAVIQVVSGCSDEQWQLLCNDEGDNRTVAVIAHHIAHGNGTSLAWLEDALAGRDVTVTPEEIDQANAEHAATYHEVGRIETIRLLERTGSDLRRRVAGLSDDELQRSAFHRLAGRRLSVEGFANLSEQHSADHLRTIRRTLDLD